VSNFIGAYPSLDDVEPSVPPFADSTKKFLERAFADRVLPAQGKDWYPSFGFFQNTDVTLEP
jgi:hypothetical protein